MLNTVHLSTASACGRVLRTSTMELHSAVKANRYQASNDSSAEGYRSLNSRIARRLITRTTSAQVTGSHIENTPSSGMEKVDRVNRPLRTRTSVWELAQRFESAILNWSFSNLPAHPLPRQVSA